MQLVEIKSNICVYFLCPICAHISLSPEPQVFAAPKQKKCFKFYSTMFADSNAPQNLNQNTKCMCIVIGLQ